MAKVAWLTEGGWTGKVPRDHSNMRNDMAWMHILDAEHIPINQFHKVSGFDYVIVTWPKGETVLNAVGSELRSPSKDNISACLEHDVVGILKKNNKIVCYMQEGPVWFSNDYSIVNQIKYYNQIANSDIIFCHNECDIKWYNGMFHNKKIFTMPCLMLDHLIQDVEWKPENKVIIGGNFAKWYGGFQGYVISEEFDAQKWIPSMHNKRLHEDLIKDLQHLNFVSWLDWMKILSTFKFAIHLMPTVAAGTFSLNCAYFGIPCIGNERVDTQRLCFPKLSVDVENIEKARTLTRLLKSDNDFYKECSLTSKQNYKKYFGLDVYKEHMKKIGIL